MRPREPGSSLILAIVIAVAVTAAMQTADAALAAEGSAAAAVLSGMAETVQAFSTGLTIGSAYKDIW
jgi:hypothetical protein